jgi:hypothetical protein
MRMKPADLIPEWDGDPDTLMKWLQTLSKLEARGIQMANQLPKIVPFRLTDDAKSWFDQFSGAEQLFLMNHWDNFKEVMCRFFWTPTWVANAKSKALAAKYRDSSHSRETPSQFLMRKKELIDMVHQWNDVDIIAEIAKSAPNQWRTIVNHEEMTEWSSYFAKIKEQEDLLQDWHSHGHRSQISSNDIKEALRAYKSQKKSKHAGKARAHAVNTSGFKDKKPSDKFKGYKRPFKADDSNKTSHPKGTPLSRGMRGCIHCGSKMHYDKECKHKESNGKNVQVYFAQADEEEQASYAAYEEAVAEEEDQDSESETEDDAESDSSSDEDF